MRRYIDADVLKEVWEEPTDWLNKEQVLRHYTWFNAVVDSIPTADVAPVVHGRWIEKDVTDDLGAKVITAWQSCKCSVCEKYLTTPYMYFFTGYAYCPNCGAHMMEGVEDD